MNAATAADSAVPQYAWRTQAITFTAAEGPKCYKTYRRAGKTFWRNYRRPVPGGVSFLQRFAAALDDEAARQRAYLTRGIFVGGALLTRGEAAGRSEAQAAS